MYETVFICIKNQEYANYSYNEVSLHKHTRMAKI